MGLSFKELVPSVCKYYVSILSAKILVLNRVVRGIGEELRYCDQLL